MKPQTSTVSADAAGAGIVTRTTVHAEGENEVAVETEMKSAKIRSAYCSSILRRCPLSRSRRRRDKSEERRARKAEKMRIKEEEEARQVAELSVYSATDNPFHDVNLGQQFRWHKKNEKERKQGLSLADAQRKDAIRRQEAKEELERLNRRRAEREAEQRLREEEELRMARMAESAQMSEWIEKDGEFQLEQERSRAAIRIREKRAKAIDFLALNLKYAHPLGEDDDKNDAGLEIDLDEPYNILDVRILDFRLPKGDLTHWPRRIFHLTKSTNFMMTLNVTCHSRHLS